jgi:hypothetical protein
MKITFFNDGGHGWYAVKRSKLAAMGLLDKISPYSYQRGQTVYLEEDADATLFFDKLSEEERKIIITKSSYRNISPIRYYERFTK